MRWLAMLLIGLFMGVVGAVVAIGALRQGTPYNDAVMAMLGRQTGALRSMREAGRCEAPEIARRLRLMQAVAGETDAAFLPVGDDALFRRYSAALSSAIDAALARAPGDCDALAGAMQDIGGACKACHDDFR